MKVIIFGSKGMAGHMISKYLKSQQYDVVEYHRSQLDITDPTTYDIQPYDVVATYDIQPDDTVINCIGLLVKECENNPQDAILVNSWWPHQLEKLCRLKGARLIHLSTDCVFNGTLGNYKESDKPDGEGWYSKSKALGEVINDKDLTIRTSIVGPELKTTGSGLFNWFLTNGSKEIIGWDNHYWNGITTLELAINIAYFINHFEITGLYHLCSNKISKYDLLCLFRKYFKPNSPEIIRGCGEKEIDKSLVDTRKLVYSLPTIEEQIRELSNERTLKKHS